MKIQIKILEETSFKKSFLKVQHSETLKNFKNSILNFFKKFNFKI